MLFATNEHCFISADCLSISIFALPSMLSRACFFVFSCRYVSLKFPA